jgi:hypothetical protein
VSKLTFSNDAFSGMKKIILTDNKSYLLIQFKSKKWLKMVLKWPFTRHEFSALFYKVVKNRYENISDLCHSFKN